MRQFTLPSLTLHRRLNIYQYPRPAPYSHRPTINLKPYPQRLSIAAEKQRSSIALNL